MAEIDRIRNKLENKHNNFRAVLYNKMGMPSSTTDLVGRSRFIAHLTSKFGAGTENKTSAD
jgi:hypothetical protein